MITARTCRPLPARFVAASIRRAVAAGAAACPEHATNAFNVLIAILGAGASVIEVSTWWRIEVARRVQLARLGCTAGDARSVAGRLWGEALGARLLRPARGLRLLSQLTADDWRAIRARLADGACSERLWARLQRTRAKVGEDAFLAACVACGALDLGALTCNAAEELLELLRPARPPAAARAA